MPSRRVTANLNTGTYYLTLTVERWYYLFDRHNRWQILAESRARRGMHPVPTFREGYRYCQRVGHEKRCGRDEYPVRQLNWI